MNQHHQPLRLEPFVLLFSLCMLISLALDGTRQDLYSGTFLFLFVAILLGFWALRKYLRLNWITIIIGLGILVRIAYILYTPVWCRQHDVIDFGAEEGHAAYIEYLLNNRALPNFDPREKWAFFQPPLHHIIAALWIKINTKFGIPLHQAQENVQVLTLFYTSTISIISYYIFKEFHLKKWGMRIACMVMAFSPVFILMSGSINNDALCISLQVAALYFAIKWYQEPQLWSVLLTAVSIGGAAMAKLSGVSVALAIGVLFLLRLMMPPADIASIDHTTVKPFQWKYLGRNILYYLKQIIVFFVICVPLALWSPIRNNVLFNVPIFYTPPVGEGLEQYSMFQRLFDLRLSSVFPAMINNGDSYDEYNILLALIKTSLFGEYNLAAENPLVNPFCILLFVTAVILAVAAFIATIYFIFSRRSTLSFEWKLFLGVFYGSQLLVYLMFVFKQQYFSSQDIRYIASILVPEALFLGMLADQLNPAEDTVSVISSKTQSFAYFTLLTCTILFALCSFCIYIGIGL